MDRHSTPISLKVRKANEQHQTMRTFPFADILDPPLPLPSSRSTTGIVLDDKERKAARLARFGPEKPEKEEEIEEETEVDLEMIKKLPPTEEMKEGKRLTVILPSSVLHGKLSLDQRKLGSNNWDLIDPMIFDLIQDIRSYVQPILYPKSTKVAMLEPVKNLQDLELLIFRKHFGNTQKENDYFERGTRWIKQAKHALWHQDFVYLLLHGHVIISAVVVIGNLINKEGIMNAARQLLLTAGYEKRCSLPFVVPELDVKCCCGLHVN